MPGESNRDQSIERLLKTTLAESLSGPGAACVGAETMAAWAERALLPAEAAAIEAHLSGCARCQELVAVFARTEPVAPAVVPFWSRPSSRWIAPLTAVAAAVLIWVAVPTDPAPVETQRQTVAQVGEPTAAAPDEKTMARVEPRVMLEREAPLGGAMSPAAAPAASARSFDQRMAAPAAAPVAAEAVATARPFPEASAPATPVPAAAAAIQAQSGERSFAVTAQQADSVAASIGPRPFPSATASAAPPPPPPPAPPSPETAQRSEAARRLAGAGQNNVMMDGISAIDVTSGLTHFAPGSSIHWRVMPGGRLERSANSGAAWAPVVFEPPVFITAAAAPAELVCWLAGRQGVVMRTLDGARFTRVTFPESVDLVVVVATDARQVTVTAADGRRFTTADAGASWRLVGQ